MSEELFLALFFMLTLSTFFYCWLGIKHSRMLRKSINDAVRPICVDLKKIALEKEEDL
jgi:hypothetical protein